MICPILTRYIISESRLVFSPVSAAARAVGAVHFLHDGCTVLHMTVIIHPTKATPPHLGLLAYPKQQEGEERYPERDASARA